MCIRIKIVCFLLVVFFLPCYPIFSAEATSKNPGINTTTKVATEEPSSPLSSKYIPKDVITKQKEEDELVNVKRREENEIEFVYSEKLRNQNKSSIDKLEEEALRRALNETGVFLSTENSLWGKTENDKRLKIRAIQEGISSEYASRLSHKISTEDTNEIKNPIFFVSDDTQSFGYFNTMNLCSIINLSGESVQCLVYPTDNQEDMPGLLRRGVKSDLYDQIGVNADFIILRDDAYSQYKKGNGVMTSSPSLDVVMYLNGDYLLMFSSSMKNIFSYEQLSAIKYRKKISIGYLDDPSKAIFERTVAKIFPNHSYSYNKINLEKASAAENLLCDPLDYDLIISFGNAFNEAIEKALEECSGMVNPITISDVNLNKMLKIADFLSIANVVDHYPVTSVLNYIEIYIALENSYRKSNVNYTKSDNQISLNNQTPRTRESDIETRRKRAEELRKERELKERARKEQNLKGKEIVSNTDIDMQQQTGIWASFKKFLGLSNNNIVKEKAAANYSNNNELIVKEDSLKKVDGRSNNYSLVGVNNLSLRSSNENKIERVYLTSNTAVKTIGIRYVLLASRYAKRENVIRVFDAIIKDYFLIRGSLLTPEMAKYNVADLILGTSDSKGKSRYHPALARYPAYLLETKGKKTPEQTVALKLLNVNLSDVKYPSFFGPMAPTNAEMDLLYEKARELNKRKEELALIRVYQRDIDSINMALSNMILGKPISDSLLKSTGLEYLNAIFDEQSVLDQGSLTEEKLTPEAQTQLQQLDSPNAFSAEQDIGSSTSVDNGVASSSSDTVSAQDIEDSTNVTTLTQNTSAVVTTEVLPIDSVPSGDSVVAKTPTPAT